MVKRMTFDQHQDNSQSALLQAVRGPILEAEGQVTRTAGLPYLIVLFADIGGRHAESLRA